MPQRRERTAIGDLFDSIVQARISDLLSERQQEQIGQRQMDVEQFANQLIAQRQAEAEGRQTEQDRLTRAARGEIDPTLARQMGIFSDEQANIANQAQQQADLMTQFRLLGANQATVDSALESARTAGAVIPNQPAITRSTPGGQGVSAEFAAGLPSAQPRLGGPGEVAVREDVLRQRLERAAPVETVDAPEVPFTALKEAAPGSLQMILEGPFGTATKTMAAIMLEKHAAAQQVGIPVPVLEQRIQNFNPQYAKAADKITEAGSRMTDLVQLATRGGAAEVATVIDLARLFDPEGVVREGEVKVWQNLAGAGYRFAWEALQLFEGKVERFSQEAMDEMLDLAYTRYGSIVNEYNIQRNEMLRLYGMDPRISPDAVQALVPDYEAAFASSIPARDAREGGSPQGQGSVMQDEGFLEMVRRNPRMLRGATSRSQ